jgi:hypothetical protein
MKLYRTLLLIQAIYTLVTAIWPILHIESFMIITGPKTDIWLVKTVSVLLIALSVSWLLALRYRWDHRPVLASLFASSTGLVIVELWYVAMNEISMVYLLDAGLQVVFLITWLFVLKQMDRD